MSFHASTSTPCDHSVVSGVFDEGGHNKPFMGPIPLVGMVGRVPDVDAIVEWVFGVIGDVSRRRDKGLVFWVGLHWVFIIDLGVFIVIAFWHGQCTMG